MKLKTEKIIKSLLLWLVFLLPFNFSYIFNFDEIKNLLFFSENLKYSIFLFDILFLIALISWLPKNFKKLKNNWILISLIVYLALNSLLIATNKSIAIYNSLRILEVVIFFCIFIDVARAKKFFDKTVYLIFLAGVIQAIIGFSQFIFQKSLGLKRFGESLLGPDILGVAKLEIAGEKFIRAYGTFPHSNLLGVFLFFSLVAGLYFAFSKNYQIPFSGLNLFRKIQLKPSQRFLFRKIHFLTGSMIILTGIVSTFSRSIWLITAYLGILLLLRSYKNLFQKKYLLKYLLPIVIFLTILIIGFYKFIPARICPGNCQDQSLALRENYCNFSQSIIKSNFYLGVGPGQFIPIFKDINLNNLPDWNIQPVHNLYLLIWSEVGLIGFFLIFIFIFNKISLQNIPPQNEFFLIVVFGFLILGFFDHYFWTLPQGQFIFWLALALLASSGKIRGSI